MIGTVLDKYEVLEKVGEGGMATVYLGRHMTLGRKVAIKLLHPHLSSSDKNRTRFAREARAIEALQHPNILRIFDYSGTDDERCFIVTEFIEGPTLRALLDDVGAMMAEPAALLARELCDALELAHQAGIVHRDLKPENVMLTADGKVKLMDFGIARIASDIHVTMTGALVGSPAYMSPEQATDSEVDGRSDLFSLGTVLYRMVTGGLPFRGSNPSIVLKAIIDGVFDDPTNRVPSLSPALADIILRCLSTERGDRYNSAREVRGDLDRFLASVGVDPDSDERWTITHYLQDFEAYEDQLRAHLIDVLVERGRSESDQGNTASALRTFNRVLALDEDNREVIETIGGMRLPGTEEGWSQRNTWLWVAPIALLVLAVAGLALTTDALGPEVPGGAEYARIAPVPVPPVAVPIAPQAPEPEAKTPPSSAPTAATMGPGRMARMRSMKAALRPGATGAAGTNATIEAPQSGGAGAQTGDERVYEGTGTLRVITTNGNAPIYIDGVAQGWTPLAPFALAAGYHSLRVPETPYSQEVNRRVLVLPADEEAENEVQITIPYKPSRVRFEGFPSGTVVELNDQRLGEVESLTTVDLGEMGAFVFSFRNAEGGVLLRHRLVRGVERGELAPGEERVIRQGSRTKRKKR